MDQIKHHGPTWQAFRPAARVSLTSVASGLVAAAVVAGLTDADSVIPVKTTSLAHGPGIVTEFTHSALMRPLARSTPLTFREEADGSVQGAVDWFKARQGNASYEWACEKAVENSYGTTGVWPSAMEHWNGAIQHGRAHPGDRNPPLGAFVYWDVAPYGHVGLSDGAGGFYSTNIHGAIGHLNSLNFAGNYLGWSDPQVPQ